MSNLSHEAAIEALCGCAATVTTLSYQEAIEGYFKLRGLPIPPDCIARPATGAQSLEVRAKVRDDASILFDLKVAATTFRTVQSQEYRETIFNASHAKLLQEAHDRIAQPAVLEAVQAEREACAQTVAALRSGGPVETLFAIEAVVAIRARGDQPSPPAEEK